MTQGSTNQDSRTTPGALPVGSKLGKYEIVEQLGAGGQAIVYKGYDGLLDRYVAIKQLSPQLAADEAFRDRLRDVVRQLARLNCEQIVTIYEFIEDRSGLFIVMEFVEGHSIESTLAANPEPVEPKAVLQIIWRIAAGLSAIHRAGIVHRDIKPGNVIVGEGLRAKITDFGVAARAGVPASMRLGTTKYMAPELFAGGQVDQRADVYSLGMVAYEMLAGRRKFDEIFHDVVRDPHSEALRWMKWHSSPEELAPLLAEVNPSVPAALSAIVEHMLAKDPDQRFQSVEELGREIRANFSARGARPVGAVAKRRRLSVDAAARAEGRGASDVLAAEPGDLTVPAEEAEARGPLTAEIPKEPISRRKKIAVVAVAGGLVMAGLIAMLVVSDIQKTQNRRQAEGLFVVAERLYNEGARARTGPEKAEKFEAAVTGFHQILTDYREKAEIVADQAAVMWYLAKAQLSILEADNKATGDNLAAAVSLNTRLQQRRDEMYDWTQKRDTQLEEFRTYWLQQKDYVDAIRNTRQYMQDGELDKALALLNGKARGSANLIEQIEEVESLRSEIRKRQKIEQVRQHIREAEDLAGKGSVPAAIAAYDKALEVLEAAKEALPPEDYKRLKQEAENSKVILRTDTEYAKAVAQAKTALRAKNRLVAADAYEKAYKLKPEEKNLLQTVLQLRHDHYLEEGLRRLAAEQMKEAERDLKKAESYLKSPAVEAAVAQLEKAKDFRRILQQGDRLSRQRNYEGALERYLEAAKYKPASKELKGKIAECNYQLALARAEGYRAKQEWDQAGKEYLKAKRAKPDRSAEVDARLELLNKEQRYSQLVAEAEDLRSKGSYAAALAKLQAAKQELAKVELDEMIKQVRYEEHVALGKRAMQDRDYAGAVAYFRIARNFKVTAEIDKLIQEAESLKGQGG